MASFGAGIARESVFIRDYEEDFANLLGGIQSRQTNPSTNPPFHQSKHPSTRSLNKFHPLTHP